MEISLANVSMDRKIVVGATTIEVDSITVECIETITVDGLVIPISNQNITVANTENLVCTFRNASMVEQDQLILRAVNLAFKLPSQTP